MRLSNGPPVSSVLPLEPGAGIACGGLSLLGGLGVLRSRENWLRAGWQANGGGGSSGDSGGLGLVERGSVTD